MEQLAQYASMNRQVGGSWESLLANVKSTLTQQCVGTLNLINLPPLDKLASFRRETGRLKHLSTFSRDNIFVSNQPSVGWSVVECLDDDYLCELTAYLYAVGAFGASKSVVLIEQNSKGSGSIAKLAEVLTRLGINNSTLELERVASIRHREDTIILGEFGASFDVIRANSTGIMVRKLPTGATIYQGVLMKSAYSSSVTWEVSFSSLKAPDTHLEVEASLRYKNTVERRLLFDHNYRTLSYDSCFLASACSLLTQNAAASVEILTSLKHKK